MEGQKSLRVPQKDLHFCSKDECNSCEDVWNNVRVSNYKLKFWGELMLYVILCSLTEKWHQH